VKSSESIRHQEDVQKTGGVPLERRALRSQTQNRAIRHVKEKNGPRLRHRENGLERDGGLLIPELLGEGRTRARVEHSEENVARREGQEEAKFSRGGWREGTTRMKRHALLLEWRTRIASSREERAGGRLRFPVEREESTARTQGNRSSSIRWDFRNMGRSGSRAGRGRRITNGTRGHEKTSLRKDLAENKGGRPGGAAAGGSSFDTEGQQWRKLNEGDSQ